MSGSTYLSDKINPAIDSIKKKSAKGPIGTMLGTRGGFMGTGQDMPELAPTMPTVSGEQLGETYTGAKAGTDAQTQLANALGGVDAINKQSAVQGAQKELADALGKAGGVTGMQAAREGAADIQKRMKGQAGEKTQQDAITGLRDLAAKQGLTLQQLQDISEGRGANPAQAMLSQATGANVANQAALMAGQRGAGSNVGMIARNAAQVGSKAQQDAAAAAAQMQANQQLGALNQISGHEQSIGGTYEKMGGLGSTQVNQETAATSLAGGLSKNIVDATQSALAGAGSTAGNMVGQQISGRTAAGEGARGLYGQVLQGAGQQNATNVGNQGNVTSAITNAVTSVAPSIPKFLGGAGNAGGTAAAAPAAAPAAAAEAAPAAAAAALAHGGLISSPTHNYAIGGPVSYDDSGNGPQSEIGKMMVNQPVAIPQFGDGKTPNYQFSPPVNAYMGKDIPAFSTGGQLSNSGGNVYPRSPNQRAKNAGDSYFNDKVPAMLSEGEIVLPRSVTMSKDPVRSAADFVAKVLAKRGKK